MKNNPYVKQVHVRRVVPNMIEYTLVIDTISNPEMERRTFHANRIATFFGPHTGLPGRQVYGSAKTLWRETDKDLQQAFKRAYPMATIEVETDA